MKDENNLRHNRYMTKQLKMVTHSVKSQVQLLLTILALMWVVEAVDFILGGALNAFGIRPRTIEGLIGIMLAPFLHGDFAHLISNSIPFAVLGWLILARSRDEFWRVTSIVWVSSGVGAWLLGAPNTVHIGASGVVFGYFGFLLTRAFFDRHWLSAVIAIIVIAAYGSLIFGVLPFQMGISWQGHLFGAIGGVFAARQLGKARC